MYLVSLFGMHTEMPALFFTGSYAEYHWPVTL